MSEPTNNIRKIIHKASSSRKLYVFMFCLFLATFFWLLNALSNNYTTEIDFSVVYKNNPKNKVVLNELPETFTIRVDALGYDLLSYKLRFTVPSIAIDLAQFKEFNANRKNSYKVNSMAFSSLITNQLGNKIDVKSIAPSIIYFSFDELGEKVVKITPQVKVNFKKQFKQFGDIEIKPAVVKVSGPASIVDTMSEVFTEELAINNLSQDFTSGVVFAEKYNDHRLKFSPEKVLLYLPVEKFTESSVKVPIDYVNVPDSIEIKAIPSELEVKFLLPLSKIASLPSAQFKAELDYNQDKANRSKLEVSLVKYPNFIELNQKHPYKVEYILKRK